MCNSCNFRGKRNDYLIKQNFEIVVKTLLIVKIPLNITRIILSYFEYTFYLSLKIVKQATNHRKS